MSTSDRRRKELRARYIGQYARDYDYSAADHEELLTMTRGTTPAFIKEWIHRAVQFAAEREPEKDSGIHLETAAFRAALEEMKRYVDEGSGRIIGFGGS